MAEDRTQARRAFLSGLGVAGAAGVGLAATGARAQGAGHWQPKMEPQDAWLDRPSAHRFVFDVTLPDTVGAGLRFAKNFFTANKEAYNIAPSDIAVLMVFRHRATSFGYNDAVWAKYGGHLSEMLHFTDPKTKKAPTANVYAMDPNFKNLIAMGAQFGVCNMATHGISRNLAKQTNADPDAVYHELATGLVPNARLVPAGILAVNRAQEHGYALATVV